VSPILRQHVAIDETFEHVDHALLLRPIGQPFHKAANHVFAKRAGNDTVIAVQLARLEPVVAAKQFIAAFT
jgi:hypothetical protein